MLKDSSAVGLSQQERELLKEHSKTCETCANEMQQEHLLNNLCDRSAKDDDSYMIPLNIMRSLIEQQTNQESATLKQPGKLHFLSYTSTAAVAVILLGIVYFGFFQPDQAIQNENEYEVALTGIPTLMVEDKEAICDFLNDNGLPEASYDLLGCEATCELVIFNLNTIEEAVKVVDMFHSLNDSRITTNVTLIERPKTQIL